MTRRYRPDVNPAVSPEEAIVIVHRFLRRCVTWAEEQEIPKYVEALSTEPTARCAATLHAWTAYRDMTVHTLHELEAGTLDHWFDDAMPSGTGNTEVDLD